MGIPLLHPWANRVARTKFPVAGREVVLDDARLPLSRGPGGLPIHGLLAAAEGWQVDRHEATEDGGVLAATLRLRRPPRADGGVSLPTRVLFEATLQGPTLTIATTSTRRVMCRCRSRSATTPICAYPESIAPSGRSRIPVRERLKLDRRMLPTGERERIEVASGPLGERTFDDEYLAPPDAAPFVLAGGGRRIELSVGPGYRFAQVYAPCR